MSSSISTNHGTILTTTGDLNGTTTVDAGASTQLISAGDPKERIKKLFEKLELSASPYDTAWVAMVPSPAAAASSAPSFPGCLSWILKNQHSDGSWGLQTLIHSRDPTLMKDTLSSTLACILALKRWGIGDDHIHNALAFVEANSSSLADSRQQTPIGFDVVFPSMIQTCVRDFNLNLPLDAAHVETMIRDRDIALVTGPDRDTNGRNAYLAYISEGIGNSSTGAWETAMKFQRKNGSLLNSPSATAAAFVRLQNAGALRYLQSLVDNNTADHAVGVPAVSPYQIHARLCLIDAVESLGIDRHFVEEIQTSLDEIYKCWQQGEEEIFLDATTCAMAFRILRLNGRPVTPDVFDRFAEGRFWTDTMEGYLKDKKAVLELHKAARINGCHGSTILESQQMWTAKFLTQVALEYSHDHSPAPPNIVNEVNDVLNYPFDVDVELLAHKRNTDQYRPEKTKNKLLKSSISCAAFGDEALLKLAIEDFNSRQSLHRQELEQLMLWLKDKELYEMKLAKVKTGYCHFQASATFSDPDHSDARILLSKHALIISLVDDLFDINGTPEECLNLVHLLERWDVEGPKVKLCSKLVETLYWAIHSTICETVEKAFPLQERNVMDHVVELWVEMLRGMLKEAEWARMNLAPTLDAYMENSPITLGVGAFLLPAMYLAGHKLEDDVVLSPQFQGLFMLHTTIGRLLNDVVGFEREAEQGKVNAVSLRVTERGMGTEEAVEDVENEIKSLTRDMVRSVTGEDDYSEVPEGVRDMLWRSVKGFFLFYRKEDLYHNSTKLVKVVESVMNQPISVASSHGFD
ncbi:unnamed protein product [Linum trigynum]